MDTLLQQPAAPAAVSDPPAGDGSRITRPAETGFSTMGRDRGTRDVLGPGGLPFPPSDFSTMGRDRGTHDVLGPGGFPGETASFPARRAGTHSR